MYDKLREECGIFGIFAAGDGSGVDVARETYMALYALQHRGQESCGIAVNDGGLIMSHKDVGLVPEVFNEMVLNHLKEGQMAIGHVRYSTTGSASRENAQPMVMKYVKGSVALAHNGNLINAYALREELENSGAVFYTTNDSEVICHIIARERLRTPSVEAAILSAMKRLHGAYSLVIMSPRKLIAVRDPKGFRPLCMGRLGGCTVFSSETCALDALGAEYVRDIKPGEVVVVTRDGIQSYRAEGSDEESTLCVFEYVYFARPDSVIEGCSVHRARLEAGALLARQYPVEADIVCGVPDSGLDAALGYSRESGIPYGTALIKNRYVGRTFIQPSQNQRERSVKIKLNALSSAVSGKRVVLVDDSIVRGTTSARLIDILREAGAREVHMRISSPPFLFPCYFGTDIDSREKLIAYKMSVEDIRRCIGADSLGFLSVENLARINGPGEKNYCMGCFTGKYPINVPESVPKDRFEKKLPL